MNPFALQSPIKGVKNIIAVGSGKGGVGKSTVSVNLAVALHKLNFKVGLLDADIYGPSLPRMLGVAGALSRKPEITAQNKIMPIPRFGVKTMSLGYLVEENAAAVWRGPMLFKAMDQFFRDVAWGELDYLIIDLPPGTGDVVLTMAQKVPVQGAVVVCTPQNVALADAKKAIDMFQRTNVPILGVVENMSHFTSPQGEVVQLFPKGDLDAYLDIKRIRKLASIPFFPEIGMSAEAGIPLMESHSGDAEAELFLELARKIETSQAAPSQIDTSH